MKLEHKRIIDHISRLEGQLSSIKTELQKAQPDCVVASQTLHSSARSFAGLRSLFVETFLQEHFVSKKLDTKTQIMLEQLLKLIKA